MPRAPRETNTPPAPARLIRRVGCVSYLNAKPLIEGLDSHTDPAVKFDVPSRLLADLVAGDVDIALCPVIDYFRSPLPLEIVPVGGIGCEGPTLTVRLFSQVPLEYARTIYADTDSHTSIALLRVIMAERFGFQPNLIDYDAREHVADNRVVDSPDAMLLIGDKVVTESPAANVYEHQMDLGEAWNVMTGMPFVFAIWMARVGASLGDLPGTLEAQRLRNSNRIDAIVDRHAKPHGWPRDLATRYLGHLLRYRIGPEHIAAIERFAKLAERHGVIDKARALKIRAD